MTSTSFEKSEAGVGFAATSVALVIALALFPARPTPPGALMLPALILAVGILLLPAMRALRRSPSAMNTENLVAFGYIFWLLLDLIQGAYDLRDASDAALRDAFIAIGVSAAAMWLGTGGRPWPLPKWIIEIASREMDTRTIGRLIPICFVFGMFNYAYAVNFDIPLLFSYLGAPRWNVPWGRNQLGGWDAFLDQMQYFGYLLPSLTTLYIVRRGVGPPAVLALIVTGIMMLFLGQGGGRRIIGVTIGAAIIVWVHSQKAIKVRQMVVVGAATIGLLAIMQFMLNVRTTGYADFAFRGVSEYDYLHVDDNFLRLAQVIDIVPAEHPYVNLQQIWFTLVRPVPRVFWPGKPIDPGFDLPSIVGMTGVSLSTSIIGEWYMSYGWFTVILGGWLHGRLARTANTLRERPEYSANPVIYGLAVMILVAGMRSMQELVLMSYALVAWWIANRLTRERPIPGR